MSKKTELLLFVISVLIFATGLSYMMKQEAKQVIGPDITLFPDDTVNVAPTKGPDKSHESIQEILDNAINMDILEVEPGPDLVLISSGEDAYKEILKIGKPYPISGAGHVTVYYTDVDAIRSADDIKSRYHWLAEIEITKAFIYKNCYAIMYSVPNIRDSYQLLDALNRRDKSDLPEELIPSYDLVVKTVNELGLEGMSEFDIVKTVNDYMTTNIAYDYHAAYEGEPHKGEISYTYDETSSVDTPLEKHMAICGGYSRTFCAIMTYCGVLCHTTGGYGLDDSGEGGPHAWNQVRIDGEWYNIDTTWNDKNKLNEEYGHPVDNPGAYSYKFFLLPDEEFLVYHVPTNEHLSEDGKPVGDIYIEKCTSTKGRQMLIDIYKADNDAEINKQIENQKGNKMIFIAYSAALGYDDSRMVQMVSDYLGGKELVYYDSHEELGYRLISIEQQ